MLSFQISMNNDNQEIDAIHFSIYSHYTIDDCNYLGVSHVLLHQKSVVVSEVSKSSEREEYVSTLFESEYSLLVAAQMLLSKSNPDVIVGHELISGNLELYLSKLLKNGIESLHLLNRRLIDPKRLKSVASRNLKNRSKILFSGRLLIDTFALSKEFVKLDEYSLASIIASLNRSSTIQIFSSLEIELRASSKIIEDILAKLQLLPLTQQLSKVAGCLWQISLRQARAERNEVLLLHKFRENNYILPDRYKKEDKDEDSDGDKGYIGGLVLEPVAGFYDSYIVLVDFNSLYPSIIRHYKICFTTVKRPFRSLDVKAKEECITEDVEQEQQLVRPLNDIVIQESVEPPLPQVLSMLITKRREVKNQMKREKNPFILKQMEIKQQAYKLIANSIYGCLGFSFSRFYSKRMAAMITHFGRELLKKSEQLIMDKGYSVIYGDTDSLMVNTFKNNLPEALICGLGLKKDINEQFKKDRGAREQILEVELDGVFKKLLLLKKKKYAGLAVTNYMQVAQTLDAVAEETKLEIKGMDLVRRDWSLITKEVCRETLNILMDSGDLDQVYAYLTKVNQNMNEIMQVEDPREFTPSPTNAFKIIDFTIKKQLNKKPSEYGDTAANPQVKVALWMKSFFNKTEEQLVNHFIPYVATNRGSSLGDKAMHMQEYYDQFHNKSATSQIFKLDIPWYKNNQIINPVNRILNVIEGHNSDRLSLIFELQQSDAEEAAEESKY